MSKDRRCVCNAAALVEQAIEDTEDTFPACPIHRPEREQAGQPIALNSPQLEASLSAALGANPTIKL